MKENTMREMIKKEGSVFIVVKLEKFFRTVVYGWMDLNALLQKLASGV